MLYQSEKETVTCQKSRFEVVPYTTGSEIKKITT